MDFYLKFPVDMRTFAIIVCTVLIFISNLSAQYYKPVRVKAGTRMQDYFTLKETYRYQKFLPGKVVFKNGSSHNVKMDYNFLNGEIEFLQAQDTLYITKKKELLYVVAQDTFYYDNGYIEVISGGNIRVGLKQYVKLKDILEEGAFGTTNRSSSIDTYSTVWTNGNYYSLIPNVDIEVQMTLEYYISDHKSGFVTFSKKNVIQLFPQWSDKIKAYIKSNKVDFESGDNLLRLVEYIRTL
jgi:hypothetical protein